MSMLSWTISFLRRCASIFPCIKAAAFAFLFLKSHLDKYKAVARPALLFFAKGGETPLKNATSWWVVSLFLLTACECTKQKMPAVNMKTERAIISIGKIMLPKLTISLQTKVVSYSPFFISFKWMWSYHIRIFEKILWLNKTSLIQRATFGVVLIVRVRL